jgi:hypothetical protein
MKFGEDATCKIDVFVPQTDSADAWVIATPLGPEIEIRLHFCDENISSSIAGMMIDLLCENVHFLVNAGIEMSIPPIAAREDVLQQLPLAQKDRHFIRPSSQENQPEVPESTTSAARALVHDTWEMVLGPLESTSTPEAIIDHTPFYNIWGDIAAAAQMAKCKTVWIIVL